MKFDIPPERLKELYKRADVLAKCTIILLAILLSIIFIVNNFDFIQEKVLILIKRQLPKQTPPPSVKPAGEPCPNIVPKPNPPWWYQLLRLLGQVDDYTDLPTAPPLYDPATIDLWLLIIFPYFSMKNKKKRKLKKMIKNGIKDIDVFRELGKIYLDEDEHQNLLILYKRALELTIDDFERATVYYEMGIAQNELEKKKEAFLNFENALNLVNSCEDSMDVLELKGLIYFNLYWLYPSAEKVDEKCFRAIEQCEKLLNTYSDFERAINIYLVLEKLYSTTGNYNKALECTAKALELAKNNNEKLECLHSMANIFRLKGDYHKAEDYYRQALILATVDKSLLSEIYCGMGFLQEEKAYKDEAIIFFKKALQNKKYNPSVRHDSNYVIEIELHLGRIYYEKKEYKKAINHFENALINIDEHRKDFCNIHLWLGHCHYEIQDYDKAEDFYKKVLSSKLAIADEIIQAQSYLANIYSQRKEHEKAVREYEKLLEMSPKYKEDPIALYNLGVAYTQLNNKSKAISYLEKIITDNLTHHLLSREDTLYRLACIYIEEEQYKKFNEYSKMLIHEFPNGLLSQRIVEYRKKYAFKNVEK